MTDEPQGPVSRTCQLCESQVFETPEGWQSVAQLAGWPPAAMQRPQSLTCTHVDDIPDSLDPEYVRVWLNL